MDKNIDISPFVDEEGRITVLPQKRQKQSAVFAYLAEKFEHGKTYTEREVNEICDKWHTFKDYFVLRRGLIDEGLLKRERNGAKYWKTPESSSRIPTALKHKPVFIVDDYEQVDGRNAETDAKGLSLGLAQWNDRGKVDISAKVWRYTGEKWSRQSEELPLHRVLDLALLILAAKKQMQDAYRFPKLYNPDAPVIDRIPLQGNAMTARVCVDNPCIDEDIKLFTQAMAGDDELLSERLHRLADQLQELGYGRRKGVERDG